MTERHQRRDIQRRRSRMLITALGVVALVLAFRLAYWQLPAHPELDSLSQKPEYVEPERGSILDATGNYLARTTFVCRVLVWPGRLDEETRQLLTPELARITGLKEAKVSTALSSEDADVITLLAGAPTQVGDEIEALLAKDDYDNVREASAIEVRRTYERVYPDGDLAAHVLGYVNWEGIGQYGIEEEFEATLAGQRGIIYGERGPWGYVYKIGGAGFASVQDGADLVLTLDRNVQHAAEDLLVHAMMELGAESGNILVLDPSTGAILAMAKRPTFNPESYFDFGSYDWFNNDLVSVPYEPGSTIKAMTLAVALQEGAIQPNSYYVDDGSIEIGGRAIYNADGQAHGRTNMTQLLAYSLNVGAAKVAQSVGPTAFYQRMRDFGFGEPANITLSPDAGGTMRVPSQDEWTMADFGRNAFGQGFSATPLQVAMAFGTLANDGVRMRPYIVSEVRRASGSDVIRPVQVKQVLSPVVTEQMTELLADAVELGMPEAQVAGYRIAGKSGTSSIAMGEQGYENDEVITSFVGYGPLPDPRWVILVKFDKPQVKKWGTESAAPVFSDMFEFLVSYYGVEPTEAE